MKTWLGAVVLAVAALSGQAGAVASNPAYLNIDVTITASLSVTVNGVASSTDATTNWTGTPNLAVAPTSTVTVQNNSGVLTEGWQLSTNANSLAASGSTWARSASTTSVGADAFAVQAVFGSSNTTTCAAASWNNSTIAAPLGTTPTSYTTTVYADSALNAGGGVSYQPDNTSTNKMYAYNAATGAGQRALCWRVILPASTGTQTLQNIQVVVTAL
jgi:hypothetical protein